MNYWIFTVTGHKLDNESYTAEDIYSQRMKDQFWGLGEKTPNRRNLLIDDEVVFYIGLPNKSFGGIASLDSDSFELNHKQKEEFGHGTEFYTSDYGVLLKDINRWDTPKLVEDFVPYLTFIENKEYWYTYFQGGVRQITEEDYLTIIGKRKPSLVDQITTTKDIESQSEFALESHLEEFIYQNWESIDWGSEIKLYQSDEQDGRQFPAGTWSIDFLAHNNENNDLVVIELKRGKTSDATVGQILRYINWLKENIAEDDQNVRGIIIAGSVDDALKYTVMGNKDIEVKTYKVDFKLLSPES